MRHIGRAVEEGIYPVPAVGFHHGDVVGFGVFLNDVAKVADLDARFDVLDGLLETLARGFDEADGVWVGGGFGADVVGLVQVAVVAFVEEGDVDVEDVAVL